MSETKVIDINELKFDQHNFNQHNEQGMELVRGQKNWNFKFSIITLDEKKAKIVEQGVDSPLKRLDAILKEL